MLFNQKCVVFNSFTFARDFTNSPEFPDVHSGFQLGVLASFVDPDVVLEAFPSRHE